MRTTQTPNDPKKDPLKVSSSEPIRVFQRSDLGMTSKTARWDSPFQCPFPCSEKICLAKFQTMVHGQAQFLLYLYIRVSFCFCISFRESCHHVYCLLLSFHFHFFPDSNVLFFTLKRILSLYKSPKIAPTLTNEAFTYLFNWRSWKRRWMRTMWWATSRTMGDQLADVTLKFCQILEIFSSWKEIIIGKSGTEAVQILLHRNWLVLFSADLLSWPPTCIMNSCSMLLMMKELLGLWVEEDQKNLMNYMN